MSEVKQIEFVEVTDLRPILDYWQTVRWNLQKPQYGMVSPMYLPKEYRRIIEHRYFEVKQGDRVVSLLRIIPDIRLVQYGENVFSYVLDKEMEDCRFCDLGLYHLENDIDREAIVKAVTEFSISYAAAQDHAGCYIQVPLHHASFYRELGFYVAGGPFTPEGWVQTYVPMIKLADPSLGLISQK